MSEENKGKRTWTEEFEVAGSELVDHVKEWIVTSLNWLKIEKLYKLLTKGGM